MAAKTKKTKNHKPGKGNGTMSAASADVMTLAEAAAYLRVDVDGVMDAIHSHGLPGREIAGQWRFLKSSLQDWLRSGSRKTGNEAFLALAGCWKDDPYVDEMLEDIYKKRGRPMIEEVE